MALASLALVTMVSGAMAATKLRAPLSVDLLKPRVALTPAAKAAPDEKIDLSRQRQTLEHLDHRMTLIEQTLNRIRLPKAGGTRGRPKNVKADREALRRIVLPENATKRQIRDYIRRINDVGRTQYGYFPDDPYEEMFRKIGADALDILLEELDRLKGVVYWDGIKICNELAGEQHKALVLKQLRVPRHSYLMGAITRNGWEIDAKPIILERLRSGKEFVDPDWIRVIASFQDPDTVPDLRRYLRRGSNPRSTHEAIKEFAGDLTEDVAIAWRRARTRSRPELNTATLAMTYGHLDALECAMKAFEPNRDSYHDGLVQSRVRACIGRAGTNAEVLAWFKTHRDKLVFDKAARKWRVPEEDVE